MDAQFPDGGQLPSYTNPHLPAGQQSSCMLESTAMDSYYTLSPEPQEHSSQLSEASSLPSVSAYLPSNPSHDIRTYPSMTSNPRIELSSHNTWSSPQLGSEESNNYSFHSSPFSGNINKNNCYNPSPVTPRTLPSPEQTPEQALERFKQHQEQEALKALHICTPRLADGFPLQRSQNPTAFAGSFNQSFDSCPDGLCYESPTAIQDLPASTFSCTVSPSEPPLGTPVFMPGTSIEPSQGGPEVLGSPPGQAEARGPNDNARGAKAGRSYAQLLRDAFMSRSDLRMTLQEIYQWFRDSTDKTNRGTKGWQNSIRHNLSMNRAFTKEDKKAAEGELTGEPKKSTVWVMEAWAATEGVQSTTRYRKKDPSRGVNGSGLKVVQRQQTNLSSRKAQSGRRGGCAPRKAASRSRSSNFGETSSSTSHHQTMHQLPQMNYAVRQSAMPRIFPYGCEDMPFQTPPQMVLKSEQDLGSYSPLTPNVTKASNEFGLSLPEPSLKLPIHTLACGADGANDDATYTAGANQGNMYVGTSLTGFPLNTADVTGVYQPDHYHNAGSVNVGGSGLFETLPDGIYDWNANEDSPVFGRASQD